MNIEELRTYCLDKKGVTEELPFDEHTLVFKVMGKMYALIPLQRIPPQCNLKCNPERAIELREQYDGVITPGYHMSKKHWNTLFLDNLPPTFVKELVNHSYDLVVSGLTKKLKTELDSI
ncbi:MmcQ/YjbR family DNA-binding protein [Flagellimonas pacifica]|uniref:Predicted DNA-binding protein, MmcQ/YjbR family n=1 Tax=Flagellimonas pacifica TaxID=1247520 RepID=A0A285MXH4_9FLAO|nr:MmcQ/YjbR family DNA-binding protein [Allomuricauda parva]SNZ01257.1 Predicted DNA-binding protein, MmcQ/YjbR family [Allomuricauda parva]